MIKDLLNRLRDAFFTRDTKPPVVAVPATQNTDEETLRKNTKLADAQRQVAASLRASVEQRLKLPRYWIPEPLPGSIPKGAKPTLAMDKSIRKIYKAANDSAVGVAGAGGLASYAFGNGTTWAAIYNAYTFLGYPFLSQLSQIVEFRKPCEILANEMTREWLTIVSKSNSEDKTEHIKAIEAELERLGAREAFRKAYELDNLFGIGVMYPQFKNVTKDILDKPLITENIEKGSLESLKCVEPIWNYPGNYNTTNPLSDEFYRPTTWYILSMHVHASRLLMFVSRPVPDMLKPMYLFGGLALQQISEPYVRNWLETRGSVNRMIQTFSTMVFGTNLDQLVNPGGAEAMATRIAMYNEYRDNSGLMLRDEAKESLENVSAPLGTLDHLQAQAQEQMASAVQVPLVKMFGITPSGLNTSTDGEIRTFYDTIKAEQERIGTPNMRRLLDIVQLSLFGEIDDDITFVWNPLWSMDEKSASDLRKADTDRDVAYIEAGVLAPEEVRQRLADDEKSGYNNIDVEDVPEPPTEEGGEQLEPEVEGEKVVEPQADKEQDVSEKAKDSRPFASADEVFNQFCLAIDEFNESKHPRGGNSANPGQFSKGSGSSVKISNVQGMVNKASPEEKKKMLDVLAKGAGIEPVTSLNAFWKKTHVGNNDPEKVAEKKEMHAKAVAALAKYLGTKESVVEKALSAVEPKGREPKQEPKQEPVDMFSYLQNQGYKTNWYPDETKTVLTNGASKVELDTHNDKWVLQTPGHTNKEGKGKVALEAVLSGQKDKFETLGVKNSSKIVQTEQDYKNSKTTNEQPHIQALKIIAEARPNPTSDQKSAIIAYKGSSYTSINNELRHGGNSNGFFVKNIVKNMREWLDKASLPIDTTLYRGISGDYAKILRSIATEGMVFKDRGFVSTTTDPNFAKKWASKHQNYMTMEISVKKGAKAAAIRDQEAGDYEYEVVAQCGSEFKVIEFDHEKRHMKVELVQ